MNTIGAVSMNENLSDAIEAVPSNRCWNGNFTLATIEVAHFFFSLVEF